MARRYAILAPQLFATRSAKTAHGVIAYSADETVVVIDPAVAGRTVRDAVPYLRSDVPIVAALHAHLEVVSGLHQMLGEDAEFSGAARTGGAVIWDVRIPPPPRLFSGAANDVSARVVLFVGSDCAVGKMTAALELTRAARERGVRARFVATGQTGIMIAGNGTAIDRVIADFASGAAEELVLAGARDSDVVFVEGQGGINHPAFAPVTLALLYGCAPDVLILTHLATRTHIDDFATPLLSLPALVAIYEGLCATVKPAPVCAVALNTHGLGDEAAHRAIAAAREATGLPCDDVVRHGPLGLYDAIAPALSAKTRPVR